MKVCTITRKVAEKIQKWSKNVGDENDSIFHLEKQIFKFLIVEKL